MGARIQNIGVTSKDFQRSLSFYGDVLALAVVWKSEKSCFFRAGPVFLVVVDGLQAEPEFSPTGRGIWLDVYVDDLDAARAALEAANAPINKVWETEDGRLLLTEDPDGNILELVQPKVVNDS